MAPAGAWKPAPKPADEAKRLETLRSFEVLDTVPEKAYDDIAFLASHIAGTPLSLVNLIDADRQWFKARLGVFPSEVARDLAFCGYAILQPDRLLEVPDAKADPRFARHPDVVSGKIAGYAGQPLVTSDGTALGTLCVFSDRPINLGPKERKALGALAREVVNHLELRRELAALERLQKDASRKAPVEGPPLEDRLATIADRMRRLQSRNR